MVPSHLLLFEPIDFGKDIWLSKITGTSKNPVGEREIMNQNCGPQGFSF